MKHFSRLVLFGILFILNLSISAQRELVKLWETDSVLKVPESVIYDAEKKVLYVSNIDGRDPWVRDGKGSIGKVGLDGKVIDAEWVSGLEGPKGLGLHKGKLYAADMNEIIVINTSTGKIENRITVTGAEGLNDVSVDKNGIIYTSDSKLKKIYKIKDGVTELFVDNLRGPNGVLMHGSDFYLLDGNAMYKMNADKSLTMITEGLEGGPDGIENAGEKDYIVSCFQGIIWYVNGDGSKYKLIDTRQNKINSADLGIDPVKKIIYVPSFWKNSIIAYQVK